MSVSDWAESVSDWRYALEDLKGFIRMERAFLYLVAIMDWYSRKVRAWRLSNTQEADFCVSALKEAQAKYGPPEIFNTDRDRSPPAATGLMN